MKTLHMEQAYVKKASVLPTLILVPLTEAGTWQPAAPAGVVTMPAAAFTQPRPPIFLENKIVLFCPENSGPDSGLDEAKAAKE